MAGDDVEIRNARIKSTMLGFEDHGLLTFWLTLDYGGNIEQGFGGLNLSYKGANLSLLGSLLRTVGVDSWEKLPGQIVQARIAGGRVVALGHALNGTWFDPARLLDSEEGGGDELHAE